MSFPANKSLKLTVNPLRLRLGVAGSLAPPLGMVIICELRKGNMESTIEPKLSNQLQKIKYAYIFLENQELWAGLVERCKIAKKFDALSSSDKNLIIEAEKILAQDELPPEIEIRQHIATLIYFHDVLAREEQHLIINGNIFTRNKYTDLFDKAIGTISKSIINLINTDIAVSSYISKLLKMIYENDLREKGFLRTPNIMRFINNICNSLRNNRPVLFCCPDIFPVKEFTDLLINEYNPIDDIDRSRFAKTINDNNFIKEFAESNKALLIVSDFLSLDWSYQRSLYDLCKRTHVPLFCIISQKPQNSVFTLFADYGIDLEIGVLDRYKRIIVDRKSLSYINKLPNSNIITDWISRQTNWSGKLFPLKLLSYHIQKAQQFAPPDRYSAGAS